MNKSDNVRASGIIANNPVNGLFVASVANVGNRYTLLNVSAYHDATSTRYPSMELDGGFLSESSSFISSVQEIVGLTQRQGDSTSNNPVSKSWLVQQGNIGAGATKTFTAKCQVINTGTARVNGKVCIYVGGDVGGYHEYAFYGISANGTLSLTLVPIVQAGAASIALSVNTVTPIVGELKFDLLNGHGSAIEPSISVDAQYRYGNIQEVNFN